MISNNLIINYYWQLLYRFDDYYQMFIQYRSLSFYTTFIIYTSEIEISY